MKLDSHQHFWNYDAAQYPWIPKGSPLHRDWLPGDLEPLLKAAGLDGCIAVQARQTLEESRWLLSLADRVRQQGGLRTTLFPARTMLLAPRPRRTWQSFSRRSLRLQLAWCNRAAFRSSRDRMDQRPHALPPL